jgi:hypothetical protein
MKIMYLTDVTTQSDLVFCHLPEGKNLPLPLRDKGTLEAQQRAGERGGLASPNSSLIAEKQYHDRGHPMQLMPLAKVQIRKSDLVYRHSPARAMVVAICMIIASVALVWLGSGLAYYVAGVLIVSLLVMHNFILARFRLSNWLARMNDEGLYLQYRSYLNHHFPKNDPTVVFLLYAEIRSARLVDERSEIPYRDLDQPLAEKSTERRRRLVELDLAGDVSAFEKALAEERAKRPANATLYKDYPVRMASPTCVQVNWSVVPGADEFLDALGQYTNIAPTTQESNDYVNLEGQSREDQERRLLELIEAGQTIDAVYIARKLYSLDLTQAKSFVEDLRSGRSGEAGSSKMS